MEDAKILIVDDDPEWLPVDGLLDKPVRTTSFAGRGQKTFV